MLVCCDLLLHAGQGLYVLQELPMLPGHIGPHVTKERRSSGDVLNSQGGVKGLN